MNNRKRLLQDKIEETKKLIKIERDKIEEDKTNFAAELALESLLRFKENLEEELENIDSE